MTNEHQAQKLSVGSRVKWKLNPSSSQSIEGEILAYVPASTKIPLEGIDVSKFGDKIDPSGITGHDRYLVLVRTKHLTRYFTPAIDLVSQIMTNEDQTKVLPVGSRVKWDSKASGDSKSMEGEILAHVPACTKIPLEGIDTSVLGRLSFDPDGTTGHDRYLIIIRKKRTVNYRTPHVSAVSLITEP
jgi:hypothetical protein